MKSYLSATFIFLSTSLLFGKERFENKVFIFQNGAEQVVQNDNAVIIRRAPFSIRFYNKSYGSAGKKYYAVMLSAFLEKSEMMAIKV